MASGFYRPSWSPDGQWLAFSTDRNTEWKGHHDGAGWEHTTGPGMKAAPQYVSATDIVYRHKGGPQDGLYSTSGKPVVKIASLRSPAWSANGTQVV